MFLKFIFTDNERDMKGFTFNSGSRHDASNELEKFIGTYITQDKDEANYSAHLYIINMEGIY